MITHHLVSAVFASARAACTTTMADARCDRCDGPHSTWLCPYFKKCRSSHSDAQPMPQSERPSAGPPLALMRCSGRLHEVEADNHCLYHSVGLGKDHLGRAGPRGVAMRRCLARWMQGRGEHRFGSAQLVDWVKWETGNRMQYEQYCEMMAVSTQWGGAPEIAATALKEQVSVWVWVPLAPEAPQPPRDGGTVAPSSSPPPSHHSHSPTYPSPSPQATFLPSPVGRLPPPLVTPSLPGPTCPPVLYCTRTEGFVWCGALLCLISSQSCAF